MSGLTPYDLDVIVVRIAEGVDLFAYRRPVIDIDINLLPKEYKRTVPDYSKIRKHLREGVLIPGAAETTKVEYVLKELPRCEACGSTDLEWREGSDATGAKAPDGYAERWSYHGWRCRACGAAEEVKP